MASSRATVAIAVILLLLASTSRSGTAAEIEGVHFSDEYKRDDVTLALHCVGLLRYKVVFKGYVAGLYLGAGVAAENYLADVPKRLELSYFWSIRGADFGKAGDQIAEQNVDAKTFAALRPRRPDELALPRRQAGRPLLTHLCSRSRNGVGADCGCFHDYTFKPRQQARAAEQALRRVRPHHDVAQALGEELGRGALLLRRLS